MKRAECNLSLDELLEFEGVREAGISAPRESLSSINPKQACPKRWPR